MIMRMKLLLVLITATTLFSGCTTVPEPKHSPDQISKLFQQRIAKVEQINNWKIDARAGFTTADDSGSVSMIWEQKEKAYHITLIAPLGQGRLDLYGEGPDVVLTTSEGKTLYGESAQNLIYRATGFIVPVDSLSRWIKGVPGIHPQININYNNDGTIASMQQEDWKIEYLDYQPHNNTIMPRKLRATNGDLKIKVVIKEWQTDE